MDTGTTDVFQTVEYSRDRQTMDTIVPRALLVCLLGLFLVSVAPNAPGRAFLLAFVFIFVVGFLVFLMGFLFQQAFEGRALAIRISAMALLVILVAVLFWEQPGDLLKVMFSGSRYSNSRAISKDSILPAVMGWALINGSIGWILFVLCRHFRPATPLLALSPAGITYRANGIGNLLVPWHEIQGVDDYEADNIFTHAPQRHPDLTAVLVSREFYERNILPLRNVWHTHNRILDLINDMVFRLTPVSGDIDMRNKIWGAAFRPKGALIQIQLSPIWFSIDPKDIREPVEARWKAFRDTPPPSSSVPSVKAGAASRGKPLVYGRWSFDGSLWQAVKFLVPLLGIAVMVIWTGWSR